MRHKIKTNRLDRFSSLRKATIGAIARSLIINQSVRTTYTKAKASAGQIERLISLARVGSLSARRQAYKVLLDHALVSRLFGEVAALFKDTTSGYTRILKIGSRRGDGARMALLEFIHKAKKVRKEKAKPSVEEKGHAHPGEEKPHAHPEEKSKPQQKKEPAKKFFGGLRGFFKKERDSL